MTHHWTTYARGEPKRRGKMNKTEQAYAEGLTGRKMRGEILWFAYEAFTLKLGETGVRYTPDFAVMLPDGMIEFHEVKGRWTTEARMRIMLAADKFPFRFVAFTKVRGGWEVEEF